MTISSLIRTAGPFTGNGVQVAFPFSFKVFQQTDLAVFQTDTTPTQSTLLYGTNYSVALNSDQNVAPGGTVTLLVALPNLYTLLITSAVPATQPASLTNAGGYFPKTIEDALDRAMILYQQALGLGGLGQTLRVPESSILPALPSAAGRASRALGFDASGNPVVLSALPVAFVNGAAYADIFAGTGAQTAFTLSQNPGSQANLDVMVGGVTQRNGTDFTWSSGTTLTFSVAPPNGVAIQARYTNALPIGTAAGVSFLNTNLDVFLKQQNPIRKYGPIVGDGVTDDSGTYLAAIASGDRCIDARGINSFIAATLQGGSTQAWLLEGSNQNFAGSANICWRFATKDLAALLGRFSVTGDGSTVGTSIGIDIVDSTRVLIDMPVITNVRGWGIYIDPGSSTSARGRHTTVRSPIIESCYIGWEDVAGTGAEYCTLENPRITLCTTIGMKTSAGNTLVSGGHIVDNIAVGVMLVNGPNAAHGTFDAVHINHNGTYDIQAVQVLLGCTWADCHIYQGDVWFDRCKGMHIDGGHFDPTHIYNYKDGSSGMNRVSGAYFPGSYGPIRTIGSNDGHDQLIIDDDCWGPGIYAKAGGKDTTGLTLLDPSPCYVKAQRDPAATQSTPTGTPTLLTYSVANYLFDRRGVQSAGSFTIPADQAGIYHIDVDLLFAGTAMSVSASFVELKVNGVTKREFGFPSINSTTKLQVQGSLEDYFNGGDVLTIVATITGTTPTFGDGSWPSNVTLRRIA